MGFLFAWPDHLAAFSRGQFDRNCPPRKIETTVIVRGITVVIPQGEENLTENGHRSDCANVSTALWSPEIRRNQ